MATKVAKIWASGKAVMNGWLAIPSGFSAEVMAQCGFDSITVDMQHGAQDFQSMLQCFQAMQAHPVTPMVRVPWNEPGNIGKVLDAGAMGVICPMINTRKEAEALVQACKYPVLGVRSNGPFRAGMYGEATSYQATANTETLCIPMIETKTAIKNLDAILDVEGIAGVYVGPSDLGLSMGEQPTLAPTAQKVIDGIKKIAELTNKAGLIPGIHCDSPDTIKLRYSQGYRYGTLLNDVRLLAMACQNGVKAVRGEKPAAASKSY